MTKKRIYSSVKMSPEGEMKLRPGIITDVEVFIYGGMIEVLSFLGESKEGVKLHPNGGISIEEKKKCRIEKKLKEKCKNLEELEAIIKFLRQKEEAMKDLIHTKNLKKCYKEASLYEGLGSWLTWSFLNVPAEGFKEELENVLLSKKSEEEIKELWLKLLNPPKDIASIRAVKLWLEGRSTKISKSRREDLIFKEVKNPRRDAREEKRKELSEVKRLITDKEFDRIKRWVKAIEEVERINEIKHRYSPQYSKIITEEAKKNPKFIKSKIKKYGMEEIEKDEET